MAKYTRQDIIELVEEEDVEFIRLQFIDIFGNIKNVAVTSSQLDRILDNKFKFNGAVIDGYNLDHQVAYFLHPDLDTFTIYPWRPQQGKVARMICNVMDQNHEPVENDCRHILKAVTEKAKQMGYTFSVRTECEFFLFDCDENGHATTNTNERASYFAVGPMDTGENVRRDMVLTLEQMGFNVESSFHSFAPAQHELDLRSMEGVKAADDINTFKMVVKVIANRHGKHATFMPKPRMDFNGSGMHLGMQLWDENGKNLFADDNNEKGLSLIGRQFMAGILAHIRGMSLITNPLVNSYKRLTLGSEAPSYITWSDVNPASLLLLPPGPVSERHLELRSPDPSSNPYLVLALVLAAGLDGIEKRMVPDKHVDERLETLSKEDIERRGIDALPNSLGEAIKAFKADKFVQNVLGKKISTGYLEKKQKEWETFLGQVTQWELDEYIGII